MARQTTTQSVTLQSLRPANLFDRVFLESAGWLECKAAPVGCSIPANPAHHATILPSAQAEPAAQNCAWTGATRKAARHWSCATLGSAGGGDRCVPIIMSMPDMFQLRRRAAGSCLALPFPAGPLWHSSPCR